MRARVTVLLPTLWLVVLAGLVLAVDSLAAPGGGSSGFGGGGGGGGGFSGGGGSAGGTGTGGDFSLVGVLIFGSIVVFGVIAAARQRKKRRERVAKVELASAEAAADDGHFGADRVRGEAADLQRAIVKAWTGRDRAALAGHLGPDLHTAAVLDGSKERATTFTERWTLALGDDAATPWRIVATAPVA